MENCTDVLKSFVEDDINVLPHRWAEIGNSIASVFAELGVPGLLVVYAESEE